MNAPKPPNSMKTAIVSDIHSNIDALDVVLADARACGADEMWFQGDLFGYGPMPAATWERWRSYNGDGMTAMGRVFSRVISIPGNHDIYLATSADIDDSAAEMPGAYADAETSQEGKRREEDVVQKCIRLNREALRGALQLQQAQGWIRQLPYIVSPLEGVYLAHGTFDLSSRTKTVENYFDRKAVQKEAIENLLEWIERGAPPTEVPIEHDGPLARPRLLIVGHTHIQMVWQCKLTDDGELSWEALSAHIAPNSGKMASTTSATSQSANEPVELVLDCPLLDDSSGAIMAVNPGSVGLPRDGAKAGDGFAWAKYALIDWEPVGASLTFRWVPYSISSFLDKRQGLKYPDMLDRLITDTGKANA
jgi:predicted phosphodiesterase